MGKVRAAANGNILDESDVHASLIDAGIYVRVDEDEPKKAKPAPVPEPPAPEAAERPTGVNASAGTTVKPLMTKDVGPLVKKKGG